MPKKRRKRVSRRAKRGTHISPKCVDPIHYRSGWELSYALYLDSAEDVKEYSYEPYPIDYVSNLRTGKTRKYWPDFEVTREDGSKFLVEIKPARKLKNMKNVKKFAAARTFCASRDMAYVLITEAELKSLGAL